MKEKNLKGIGGWLIIVCIGLIISPIKLLIISISTYLPIFTDGTWESVTTEGAECYIEFWGSLLIVEMLYNIIILILSIYLLYLFLKKHFLFPKFYIGIAIASTVFIFLDAWLFTFVFPEEPMFDVETISELKNVLILWIIWIPYMLKSKRVKATFVKKIQSYEQPTPEDSIEIS